MNPVLLAVIISFYFLILLAVAYFTGRNAGNAGFFLGNHRSPWYIVSFGMIGASLTGVTFISIPGWVGESNFSYMQMVLGYLAGYYVIANILMPLYYKMGLTSIYTYLGTRFGRYSYKTGASFFLLSRTTGSALRIFLVANVLQFTVLDTFNIPFYATVMATVAFIWIFTFRGGIKTIIWTDTIQTFAMLASLVLVIYYISRSLGLNIRELINTLSASGYTRVFYFEDWKGTYHFVKQFIGGAFIAITMTGLDQDMMQKNLSCRNIKDAKKNMFWFSLSLVPVNLLFLTLGALLFLFAARTGIQVPENTDDLFPLIATGSYLPSIVSFFFIIGIISTTYSGADSALTSLTTSFSIDILEANRFSDNKLKRIRHAVHLMMAILLIVLILVFKAVNNENVIKALFTIAGYTYGPLLGLYAFGLFTRWNINDRYVPVIAIISPVICFIINNYSAELLWGYRFGFELILLNGIITFVGLYMIRRPDAS